MKNVKERKERIVLFIKNAKERENVVFFWKECKNVAFFWKERLSNSDTLPVLMECRTEEDKRVLEEILQEAGWHSSFEWPEECTEFIREVKKEVKKLGYAESTHDIKIRPVTKNKGGGKRKGRRQVQGSGSLGGPASGQDTMGQWSAEAEACWVQKGQDRNTGQLIGVRIGLELYAGLQWYKEKIGKWILL